MPKIPNIICDTFCEIWPEIQGFCADSFWHWPDCDPAPGSVVVFSRQTMNTHYVDIKQRIESGLIRGVLANPTEGSITLKHQCQRLGLMDLLRQRRLLLVGCGLMEPELPYMLYDSYLCKPYEYQENRQQCSRQHEIYAKLHKPYKFLFLNGRTRSHRKYMIESLRPVLDQALWTNLDSSPVWHKDFDSEMLDRPCEIQLLPTYYEVDHYQNGIQQSYTENFVKAQLFNQQWGEIYIKAEPYIDTYFSVVTETVHSYPYSLRSEKIYKPIAMGHPWIAVANQGFYRDIRNRGFKTYHSIIDESFDAIENNQQRLDRVATVVLDLCKQNLQAFLVACEPISVYNQQLMAELGPQIRTEFPQQFLDFVAQGFDRE